MANHNLYIPEKYEKLLEEKRIETESLGQCAKRLLLDLLMGNQHTTDNSSDSAIQVTNQVKEHQEKIEALEQKLEDMAAIVPNDYQERLDLLTIALEESLANIHQDHLSYLERFNQLEEKLEHLAPGPAAAPDEIFKEHLDQMENWIKTLQTTNMSEFERLSSDLATIKKNIPNPQRLTALEERLTKEVQTLKEKLELLATPTTTDVLSTEMENKDLPILPKKRVRKPTKDP